MTMQTKQFIVPIKTRSKSKKRVGFFDIAQKNIIKNKKRVKRNLSEKVDQIVYGL